MYVISMPNMGLKLRTLRSRVVCCINSTSQEHLKLSLQVLNVLHPVKAHFTFKITPYLQL